MLEPQISQMTQIRQTGHLCNRRDLWIPGSSIRSDMSAAALSVLNPQVVKPPVQGRASLQDWLLEPILMGSGVVVMGHAVRVVGVVPRAAAQVLPREMSSGGQFH